MKQMKFPFGRAILTPDGKEIVDSTPMALPVGFERPESIQELIRRLVMDPALRERSNEVGVDSFEDADDFDIPGDEFISPHEDQFDPLHLLAHEMEVNSGTSRDLSPESKAASAALIKEHAAKKPPTTDEAKKP